MSALAKRSVRCAVYTRKSVDQGLEQEYNTLDSQRECCESYVRSREPDGWTLIPERYDDGGYSGGDMNRPAFQRLLSDVRRGLVDMVVCYKIDRLSRRLSDFAEILKTLEAHSASFCCVTQEFNTSTSMGRMCMNLLMTFAQFERELDSERIRDKMAQSKRKGLWLGGVLPYGYLVKDKRLLPDPATAGDVKFIFQTFLRERSRKKTCRRLTELGMYRYPERKVKWNTVSLTRCLRNCTYVGMVRIGDEILPGMHPAVIEKSLWDDVQRLLDEFFKEQPVHRTDASEEVLLRGLVRCGTCGSLMGSRWTKKATTGAKYWYYVDAKDAKSADGSCPVKSVSSAVLDPVVEREVLRFLRTPTMVGLIADRMKCMTYRVERELADAKAFWTRVGPIAQRRIVRLLVSSVTVYEDRVEVRFRTRNCRKLMEEVKYACCDGN